MEPGTYFEFTSPTPSPSTQGKLVKNNLMFRNSTTFTTDIGVEKGFRIGRFRPLVFFEITNLFNGKRPAQISRFWKKEGMPRFGLPVYAPTPLDIRDNNAEWDEWESFRNHSREVYFGVRRRV